jgi:hypothetical protein
VGMTILPLLHQINQYIVNPLILLIFSVALLIFFYGLFQFIQGAGEAKTRDEGKKKIMYGLIGMVIMFSAYGLVRLVLNTFGLSYPTYLSEPQAPAQ